MSENLIVPPGLESFFPLYPALKRWAMLGRPFGTGFAILVVSRFSARKRRR
jgi:hypothetical protein